MARRPRANKWSAQAGSRIGIIGLVLSLWMRSSALRIQSETGIGRAQCTRMDGIQWTRRQSLEHQGLAHAHGICPLLTTLEHETISTLTTTTSEQYTHGTWRSKPRSTRGVRSSGR